MKTSAKVLLAALLAMSSASFAMTMTSISADQMKQTFVNQTFTSISTAQLNGKSVENNFTGYLDDQGHAWGKFMHTTSNAPQADQGTYIIKDDGALCLTWQHWMDGKQFCVYAYDTTNAYLIIGDDNMFNSAFMKNAFKSGKQL